MPGAPHDGDDFIRDIPSSDSAEGAGQPADDHRIVPLQVYCDARRQVRNDIALHMNRDVP